MSKLHRKLSADLAVLRDLRRDMFDIVKVVKADPRTPLQINLATVKQAHAELIVIHFNEGLQAATRNEDAESFAWAGSLGEQELREVNRAMALIQFHLEPTEEQMRAAFGWSSRSHVAAAKQKLGVATIASNC